MFIIMLNLLFYGNLESLKLVFFFYVFSLMLNVAYLNFWFVL